MLQGLVAFSILTVSLAGFWWAYTRLQGRLTNSSKNFLKGKLLILAIAVILIVVGVYYSSRNNSMLQSVPTASDSCASPKIVLIPKTAVYDGFYNGVDNYHAPSPENGTASFSGVLFGLSDNNDGTVYSTETDQSYESQYFSVEENRLVTTHAGWGSWAFTIKAKARCGSVSSKRIELLLNKGPYSQPIHEGNSN